MKIAVFRTFFVILIYLEDITAINYPIIIRIRGLDDDTMRRAIQANRTSSRQRYLIELAKQAHLKRVYEVTQHLEKYYLSTLYLYNEMKKIKSRGFAKDKASNMLFLLDRLHGTQKGMRIRKRFIECYKEYEVPKPPIYSFRESPNNNLVIHYLKDPYNDGVN